jgi:8-amino-7-oxononanoate synthase
VLDFTSALYLGLQHPSCALAPWRALTTGAPAALTEPMEARKIARALAGLQGCEAAVLGTSTLHLAWDLFGLLAEKPVALFVDAGVYPITRWGVERAAMRGALVRFFPHHNIEALEHLLESETRSPVIVTDGLCPNCGSVAPLVDYLALARKRGGLLVMDDTQALGVLGREPNDSVPYGSGGGGSLPWSGVSGPETLVFSSLAKGFGVPLAVFAASRRWIRRFKQQSLARVHCSPPSIAALRAAQLALELNHKCADSLRRKLAQLVGRFQEELQAFGIHTRGGKFPIQTLALPGHINPVALHGDLEERGLRAVLRRNGGDSRPQVTLMLNAGQSLNMLRYAAGVIADALAVQEVVAYV